MTNQQFLLIYRYKVVFGRLMVCFGRPQINIKSMASLAITIKPKSSSRFVVELNLDRLERLAAGLGFFGADYKKSLARAERDFKESRIQKIKSLAELE